MKRKDIIKAMSKNEIKLDEELKIINDNLVFYVYYLKLGLVEFKKKLYGENKKDYEVTQIINLVQKMDNDFSSYLK